jgi:hypothetical protein
MSVNGRIDAYVQGETPVDFLVNYNLPNQYTQRWTPPQVGPAGPTGPQGGPNPWIALTDYPVISPETDDTARFARACAALSSTRGGTVYHAGGDITISSWPSFATTTSVTLMGAGGRSNGAPTTSRIVYTGTTPVNARSSHGFRLVDIQVIYTNPSLTGKLFDLSHATGSDSTYASFERCTIVGSSGTATSASSLISLANAHDIVIRECLFNYAVCAVRGKDIAGDFSNVVKLERCEFGQTSQAPIQSAGESWNVDSGTFEGLSNGNAGAYVSAVGAPAGLAFTGACWFGDVNSTGTWIDFGTAASSVAVDEGCRFSGGARAVAVGNNTFGAVIMASKFEGQGSSPLPVGVDVGTNCTGVIVLGNDFKPSGATIVTVPVQLADKPQGSIFQFLSNENTTPTTYVPGKIHADDYVSLKEIVDPGVAGAADRGRLFLKDNGSGKTQLCVRFQSGAAIVLATEP